jgi:NAD+-dependent protein deacetylase SIR2
VYNNDKATTEFHKKIREISTISSTAHPTAFHEFLANLARDDRLLRLYTQNIDCIDTRLPGLATSVPLPHHGPWPRTIQLHGSLEHVICQKCRAMGTLDPEAFHGPEAPSCANCIDDQFVRRMAGKRSHGVGKLRPRITLYGEDYPFDSESIGSVVACDLRSKPDALIVVGTTLHLPGVQRIVREMAHTVANNRTGLVIWANREPPPQSLSTRLGISWDFIVQSSSDEIAGRLLRRKRIKT